MLLVLRPGLRDRGVRRRLGCRAAHAQRRPSRLGRGGQAIPLTAFQARLARLVATNRSDDSYLAGGAALHFEPNTKRYSNDLDYFHDSVERVARAFEQDRALLEDGGYDVQVDMRQPGFIRAVVSSDGGATKVEWAHDSAWRFLPAAAHPDVGYVLQPVDLAINKVLALVGRDEARDFLDVLDVHQTTLPLGALCWAAAGKDPGFTPLSLLDLLRRRGRHRPEDFERLHLAEPVDLVELKTIWLAALDDAEAFIRSRPLDEVGCLYYSVEAARFVRPDGTADPGVVPHYGRPGGVLPNVGA